MAVPLEVLGIGVDDEGPGIVDQDFLRGATEVGEADFDSLEDRCLSFIDTWVVEFAPTEGEGEAVNDNLDRMTADGDCVWGPVELRLCGGRRLEVLL